MIAALDRVDEGAFNERRKLFENRRAQAAGAELLSADRVALALERLKKRIRDIFVLFAEDVQREDLGLFDDRVRVRVGLDADGDERRFERDLRHPVDRRGGDTA